jgi:hypothetical protein
MEDYLMPGSTFMFTTRRIFVDRSRKLGNRRGSTRRSTAWRNNLNGNSSIGLIK